ncbi:hypothetical protein GGX14DRAFT_446582 [Mycena pura]|uniref:Uncharacterized protein n=1 Tax=Mycena pura TaxID=153505 RepID=A0AAD6VKQ7_9AGAR|nr:hypothetical protein GGX14DRAFT_446582 [Mycena pura]
MWSRAAPAGHPTHAASACPCDDTDVDAPCARARVRRLLSSAASEYRVCPPPPYSARRSVDLYHRRPASLPPRQVSQGRPRARPHADLIRSILRLCALDLSTVYPDFARPIWRSSSSPPTALPPSRRLCGRDLTPDIVLVATALIIITAVGSPSRVPTSHHLTTVATAQRQCTCEHGWQRSTATGVDGAGEEMPMTWISRSQWQAQLSMHPYNAKAPMPTNDAAHAAIQLSKTGETVNAPPPGVI